jgi:hypothetical protein
MASGSSVPYLLGRVKFFRRRLDKEGLKIYYSAVLTSLNLCEFLSFWLEFV